MTKFIRRILIIGLILYGFYVIVMDLASGDAINIAVVVVAVGAVAILIWRDVKTAPTKQAELEVASRNKDRDAVAVSIVNSTYWTCPACNENNPEWHRICRACQQPVFLVDESKPV